MSNRAYLKDVVEFIRGVTFKPDNIVAPQALDAVVVMRTKNIQKSLDVRDLIAVSPIFVRRKEQYLQEGDVLLSSANSWALVGKSCYVPALDYKATAGGFISIVRAKKEHLDSKYFFHWITSGEIQHEIRHCGRQTTNISNLDVGRFLDLEIPLPPLAEQKRIADILDKADALRHKRRQAVELADQFLRSVFLDMFGDPVTNPKGWETGTIRDLVAEAKYGTSAKADSENGAFPMLRMGNLTYTGQLDLSSLKYVDLDEKDHDKYLVKDGDLLFNRTNSKELVGKTAVYDLEEPMAAAGYLVRIRTNDKGNSYYLSGYLNSQHGKQTLVSMCKSIVGMANINAQEVQEIKIFLPPLELQNEYEKICKAVRVRVEKHKESVAELNNLFLSLSQRAFSGKL